MEQQAGITEHEVRVVNVAVATVWTDPERPRKLDEPSLQSPVRLEEWLSAMTTEERLDLCDKNMVQTQVLYGQKVYVVREEAGWAHVLIPNQPTPKDQLGYPGWIPCQQLSTEIGVLADSEQVVQVRANTAHLYKTPEQKGIELSFQTRLPYSGEEQDWLIVSTIEGHQYVKKEDVHKIELGPKSESETEQLFRYFAHETGKRVEQRGEILVELGKRFLGLPYLWAGVSSFGYDCSGFVYSMYQALGITIPRDASAQAKAGLEVELDQLQAGDLLFFAYEEGKGAIHHVGMYIGNGEMIHSPKTGKPIEITPLADTLYEQELCGARRYWA